MQAVELGTGRIKNVFNAQITGFSMIKEFVFLSLTNVTLLIQEETVLLAIKDIILSRENVS